MKDAPENQTAKKETPEHNDITQDIFKPMVYDVSGSNGNVYKVTNYRPNRWSCQCNDFLYRSHDKDGYSTGHKCKHILSTIEKLGGAK